MEKACNRTAVQECDGHLGVTATEGGAQIQDLKPCGGHEEGVMRRNVGDTVEEGLLDVAEVGDHGTQTGGTY